jgi:hypothetical protein
MPVDQDFMAMDLSRNETKALKTVVYLRKWRLKKLGMLAMNIRV